MNETSGSRSSDLRGRTFAFASRVIDLVESLPRTRTADIIGRQLLRAGTAVGANYRSVSRAQSEAHMVSKLALVEEESDECGYWLDLLIAKKLVAQSDAAALRREASELTAIMVASKKTLKARAKRQTNRRSKFVVRSSDGEP